MKAEEDARRRKEEEDDYIRAQVEARQVAEEEEALKLKKEREAELFTKSMKLAAGMSGLYYFSQLRTYSNESTVMGIIFVF